MLKCMESPVFGLCVGAFAAVGVASVAMMMTRGGRNIIVNLCSCASHCTKTVGSAAEEVAKELRDSFLSSAGRDSCCDCGSDANTSGES